MNEVKLLVGGREYTVACAPGEEDHVSALGIMIDEKVRQLGEGVRHQEAQKLLFSALFLADELHEAKRGAEASEAEKTEALREANFALGRRDEMQLTISRLEAELEGLQSAQQRHSAEVDDIRTELAERREEAELSCSELEKAIAQIADLEQQLEQERAAFEQQLEEATRPSAPLKITGSLADDPDLAPALERFADLLETCADKLETGEASA